jgi:putative ATP-dependent endonuclease of OLD family
MRISRLCVRNFRSIEDVSFDIPKVCALVGPNNAGKSNLLEALRRVLGTNWVSVSSFAPDDVYLHDQTRDIEISCTLDPPVQYQRFKNAPVTEIHGLSFEYTRYKVGDKKGLPRLEQRCRNASGQAPMVLTRAPKKGEPHQYEPIVGVPSEVRDAIPLIYIGTNRSLKEQLPSARNSLLRQMFEDINNRLHDPTETVPVTKQDGSTVQVSRIDRFDSLIQAALKLLRTDAFTQVETAIKTNVLRQFGLDPVADADKIDLYFTPMESFDFYKTLDLKLLIRPRSIATRHSLRLCAGSSSGFLLVAAGCFAGFRRLSG